MGAGGALPCAGSAGGALPSAPSAEAPPYSLPVTLPAAKQSPPVDANAPYTAVVLDLIHQLEPSSPPARAEIANAAKLLHDGPSAACHNVGPFSAPAGTNPSTGLHENYLAPYEYGFVD